MSAQKPMPIFRFKDDPIHMLIMDTLSKKPVNSDYFSLVKRIKLSEYIKNPVSSENLETIAKRSKEYMAQVGFAYGRLIEKQWVSDEVQGKKLRMHAPGPVIRKKANDIEEETAEIPDTFKSKKLVSFQKVKNPELLKKPVISKTQARVLTTRPTTRISASQRQAREYLNYLEALSSNEQSFLNFQVNQKKNQLSQKFDEECKKKESELNLKGIFPPEFNKERALSMIPVKMLNQHKISIEPMVRKSKEIMIREKIKENQLEIFNVKKNKSENLKKSPTKEQVMDLVEATITKKQVKGKKRESSLVGAQKKVKMHWADRLNKSMVEIIDKTKPDEREMNMPML
jgi:hypothetical protein